MSANKHTPFLSNEQVQALNEKHGWFKHGDAQSDVSRAFANDAVEAYERVRSAAPELYAAVAAVIDATRAYLPPDGITKEEFISRVIEATDSARMAEIMK